jgi:hypothetical protein
LVEVLAGPLAGASIGAMVVLGLAMAGPGRYYGWRLQKVLDLIDGMDDIPELTRQRRELIVDAERLAKRVAAHRRVPTEWDMYFFGLLSLGVTYGLLIGAVHLLRGRDLPLVGSILAWVLGVAWVLVTSQCLYWATRSIAYTREERWRFVREGMPSGFRRRFSPRPKWLGPNVSEWDRYSTPVLIKGTSTRDDAKPGVS